MAFSRIVDGKTHMPGIGMYDHFIGFELLQDLKAIFGQDSSKVLHLYLQNLGVDVTMEQFLSDVDAFEKHTEITI
jgi:hypothetical protein